MGYIYKITNTINNKLYIGKTINTIASRWGEHQKNFTSLRDDMVIHKAMYKYGKEAFIIEEIEQCDNSIINEREQYWIAYYDTYNNGYNSTIGGDGAPKIDREQVVSCWHNGMTITEICETIGTTRHTVSGILAANGVETLATKTRALGKRVEQYTLDGIFVKEYDSISDAARSVANATPSNINSCCARRHTSAYNYLWKYKDDPTPIQDFVEKQKTTGKGMQKQVEQYDLDNNYIQTFNSCREAARSIGAPYHVGINSCCLGKQKTAYGYKWRYKI